ncbi:MAG: carboxyl transferase domain-containing protein [Halobacteriota archaeon]|nr:carboxyl transferase domain-containing protein [Halobacteriota archaeon]
MLKELMERKEKIRSMGGEKGLEKQRKLGKLNARERIDVLLDEGSFVEIGGLIKHRGTELGIDKREIPAGGVVTGYGKIDGRKVYVFSQDFTSLGGSLGEMHARKICEVLDRATKQGCPVIGINDSGGARIQEGVDALSGYGQIFYRNTIASGVIPQICAILGPCAGGAVYSPALMDFIFMVKSNSYAFITGPRVIKEVIGEEVNEIELGGAITHQQKSGVAHRAEENEEECLRNIRRLLSYLPSNNLDDAPRIDYGDDPNRVDEGLFDVTPANPNKPYDMYELIDRIFDRQGEENYFDIAPLFAPNIITCFARLNGVSVGIIANQPKFKAGCLDIDACDKASRFIRFCDAFSMPIITLVDVPGYLPGTEQEWGGIIRHGAKMLFAYSEATVPKITLTIRKAYGGSYLAMCSKDLGADTVLCWPSTELAVMGPEGAAPIIFRKDIEAAEDKVKIRQEKIQEYRETFANPYKAAEHLHIDDVIDPAETRPRLIEALEAAMTKREQRPKRKHGIIPT